MINAIIIIAFGIVLAVLILRNQQTLSQIVLTVALFVLAGLGAKRIFSDGPKTAVLVVGLIAITMFGPPVVILVLRDKWRVNKAAKERARDRHSRIDAD